MAKRKFKAARQRKFGKPTPPVLNQMQPLSLAQCMIVKDEEKNIERALSWEQGIASERTVEDTGSTDRTVEKISVIVPTYNRESYLQNLIRFFLDQTYSNKELLIADDSDKPCSMMPELCREHSEIKYFYQAKRQTIGEKRNQLLQVASGELIAQFDDDDYYAPQYLETMHQTLLGSASDFLTLSRWFAYSAPLNIFAYWETDRRFPLHYRVSSSDVRIVSTEPHPPDFIEINLFGFGFSYFFRRRVFESVQYAPMNCGEDYNFYCKLVQQGFKTMTVPDETGLVLHLLHQSNTSLILPQYLLPTGLLSRFFDTRILRLAGYLKS